MPRSTHRLRPAVAGLAAAGVVLALGACASPAKPGAAAVVGSDRITDTAVADQTAELIAALGGKVPAGLGQVELNRQVISNEILEVLVTEVAAREGIVVTDADVAKVVGPAVAQNKTAEGLVQNLAMQQTPVIVAPSDLDAYVRMRLQLIALETKLGKGDQKAGAAAAFTKVGDLSVEYGTTVSPRFGTWVPAKLGVGPAPDDLSRPLPTAVTLPADIGSTPSPAAS
jgi:hypothetical protein